MTPFDDHNRKPPAAHSRGGSAVGDFWQRLARHAPSDGPEFPPGVDQPPNLVGRRSWMKMMGASAALAGAGCDVRPDRHILPYAEKPPERSLRVERLRYATSIDVEGLATGLVVDSQLGRPVKVEGNPLHPASHGATLPIHQGSLLQLYDPERAQSGVAGGEQVPAELLLRALAMRAPIEGLWVVTPPQSSPLARQLFDRIRARHPGARIESYTHLGRHNVYRGSQLAFGRPLEIDFAMERAAVVVSFEADFLASPATALRWSRAFAERRRLSSPEDSMNRLYVAEGMPTPTGTSADHRLAIPTTEVGPLTMAVAALLGRAGRPVPGVPSALLERALGLLDAPSRRFARAVAADLAANPDACAIVVGEGQPPAVHALVQLMHVALDTPMSVLRLLPAPLETPTRTLSPHQLADAIEAREVRSLALLGVDPVYGAPAELDLAAKLATLDDSLHHALYFDETSAACRRFIPASHYLESWSDSLAYDSTRSVIQPLIQPLYETASMVEVLAALAGDAAPEGRQLLREAWAHGPYAADGEEAFVSYLSRGFVQGSSAAPVRPTPNVDAALPRQLERLLKAPREGFQLQVAVSNSVYDGGFANVSWLQELPQPLTSLTWGNAALINDKRAQALGLQNGDLVELAAPAGTVSAPVLSVPGQPERLISLVTGYGQRPMERTAIALAGGANVYRLWADREAQWVQNVRVTPTGKHSELAITQQHHDPHDREIALHTTLEFYRAHPDFTHHHRGPLPTMHPAPGPTDHGWVMTIDTSICTGCNSCVLACQAENNVPVVGPEGVRENREMHWLRVDRYLYPPEPGAGLDTPRVVHQPMLCQHCDHAPCEYVCPVGATVHSHDGLNEMIYNRCIGTRFCSNNCPYKVRRFNWFEYNEGRDTRDLALNPDVTVRARGVMEKCTYCVQRIRRAEHTARMQNAEEIPAGAVQTACQQACPTAAIQFAQHHHEDTLAVRWRRQPRRYNVLHQLGARPRTMYLADVRNPKPDFGS